MPNSGSTGLVPVQCPGSVGTLPVHTLIGAVGPGAGDSQLGDGAAEGEAGDDIAGEGGAGEELAPGRPPRPGR